MLTSCLMKFDEPRNINGYAAIFGATGGVMEAALRTVYEIVAGKELNNIDLPKSEVLKVKEATIDIEGTKINIAVAHGLSNARNVLDRVKNGKADYRLLSVDVWEAPTHT